MCKNLSLSGLLFVLFSFTCVNAFDIKECRQKLLKISLALYEKKIYDPELVCFLKKYSDFCEEDLISYCDAILLYPKELGDKTVQVLDIKEDLVKYLRSFVASGMDLLEVDANLGLFCDCQNPDFIVTFKNPEGETKARKYSLEIWSIGLKIELVIRIECIKIVGADFNYYDSMGKEYNLGHGIDVALYQRGVCGADCDSGLFKSVYKRFSLGLCVTTAEIKGTKSMLIIGGIAFGLGLGIEAGYVTSGKMTPVFEWW